MLLYCGRIIMEDGFTGRHSKGLFTFYREQGEQEAKLGQIKSQLVKVNEGNRHYASAVAVNVRQEKNKDRVGLIINHQSSNKASRYKQEDCQDRHQIYTSKHVFSLNFNSPRKNGYYMQIVAERNRRAKSQLDEYPNKPLAIKINRRCLIGQLSVRQMPSSIVKELFQPKKDAASKVHASRKKLQVEENESHETLKSNRESIFHVPVQRFRRCKGRPQFKPTIAKDMLELRRHKLCSNGYWQQIKQKKLKHEGSIPDINRKIQEWITINDMGKSKNQHLPRISPEPTQ